METENRNSFDISENFLSRRIKKRIRSFANEMLLLFFPAFCVACKEKLKSDERVYCRHCFERMIPVPEPVCPICGGHISSMENKTHCSRCPERPINFEKAYSVFYYGKIANQILKSIKYNGRRDAAELAGKIMTSFYLERLKEYNFDFIIPVPLHHYRFFMRGYNQSELLVQQISKYTGLNIMLNNLVRVKRTIKQSMLPHESRRENVKGVFGVDYPEFIKGKTILLVDDIMTTGSTLNECSSVLMKAGAEKIIVFTFARA